MLDYSFISNEQLVAKLKIEGFCKTSFLSESQIAELTDLYEKSFNPEQVPPVFMSAGYPDFKVRKSVHNSILEICRPSLEELFHGFKPLIALFFAKNGKVEEKLHLHQDPSFVDQSRHLQLGLWVPFQKAVEENGGMFVIPGSHLFFNPHQSRTIPQPWNNVTEDLLYKNITGVPLEKGEALIMDNRLLHGSFPNSRNERRLAMVIKLSIPESEVIDIVYPGKNKNSFSIYQQDDDYLVSEQWNPAKDDNAYSGKYVKEVLYQNDKIDDKLFLELLSGEISYENIQSAIQRNASISEKETNIDKAENKVRSKSGFFHFLNNLRGLLFGNKYDRN